VTGILVTGFGPFAGRAGNGSQAVVQAIDARRLGGVALHGEVWPVRWGIAERRLPGLLARLRPALVLGLGEGGDRIAVETRAANHRDGIDAGGRECREKVVPGGEPVLLSKVVPDVAGLRSPRPVAYSEDAGTFLCNNAYYVALRATGGRALFCHLPPQGTLSDLAYARTFVPVVRDLLTRHLARRPSPDPGR